MDKRLADEDIAGSIAYAQALKQAGACTLAQDRQSSVIYGMARVAVEQRLIDHITPIEQFSDTLVNAVFQPAPEGGAVTLRRFNGR